MCYNKINNRETDKTTKARVVQELKIYRKRGIVQPKLKFNPEFLPSFKTE